MKILDIPQSGKRGLTVSQRSRYGLISRALVIPSNPRTPSQMNVRSILTRVTAGWRGLAQAQRMVWTSAAKEVNSLSRLGQSGTLTGSQLFTKINCTLLQFDQPMVDVPPDRPMFDALVPEGLTITNAGGVITLKLVCPSDPGENTVVRGCAPVSQGREVCDNFRILGLCPAPAQGSADITSLYTARFGAPPVGKKVFVRVNHFVDGWEDWPLTFSAIVPPSA